MTQEHAAKLSQFQNRSSSGALSVRACRINNNLMNRNAVEFEVSKPIGTSDRARNSSLHGSQPAAVVMPRSLELQSGIHFRSKSQGKISNSNR
jgi:hypothetical protein